MAINRQFWEMSPYERKVFVLSSISRQQVQRRTTGCDSARQLSCQYTLSLASGDVCVVCKTFFLTTLGYMPNNDRIIRSAISGIDLGSVVPKPEMRGKTCSKIKVDRSIIIAHIESFHPVASHYRREHAPRKRYLPSDLSTEALYRDFIRGCDDAF
jgi:hypothetical protein